MYKPSGLRDESETVTQSALEQARKVDLMLKETAISQDL